MFEEPSTWILKRQHVAGTAERLTRRATSQEVGDPIIGRALWTKVFGFNLLDGRLDHRGINKRRSAVWRVSALVRPKRLSAIWIAVNGRNRDEPSHFEADVQPAGPCKQRNQRWANSLVLSSTRHVHTVECLGPSRHTYRSQRPP